MTIITGKCSIQLLLNKGNKSIGLHLAIDIMLNYSLGFITIAFINPANQLVDIFFQDMGFGERVVGRNDTEQKMFALATLCSGLDKKKILQRLVTKLFRKSRIAAIVGRTDVFHSTFSFLPTAGTFPLSFLTIYDMIPVLHPEYFWGVNTCQPASA